MKVFYLCWYVLELPKFERTQWNPDQPFGFTDYSVFRHSLNISEIYGAKDHHEST